MRIPFKPSKTKKQCINQVWLADIENVGSHWSSILAKATPGDQLYMCYTDLSPKPEYHLLDQCTQIGMKLHYVHCDRTGKNAKNAADFQIASLLGYLLAKQPENHYIILSNDNGFQHVITFWKSMKKNVKLEHVETAAKKLETEQKDKIRNQLQSVGLNKRQIAKLLPFLENIPKNQPESTQLRNAHNFCQKTFHPSGSEIYRQIKPIIVGKGNPK